MTREASRAFPPGLYAPAPANPAHPTWARLSPRDYDPYDVALPVRSVFWAFPHAIDNCRTRTTWAPASMTDAIIDYVHDKHGVWPVEVLGAPSMDLDPGGSVLYAKEVRSFAGSIPYTVGLSLAGEIEAILSTAQVETKYGTPCRRFASYVLTVVPDVDVEPLCAWLRTVDAEFQAHHIAELAKRGITSRVFGRKP